MAESISEKRRAARGPEGLKLWRKPVGQGHPGAYQVLAGAGEDLQGFRLVGVGHPQCPEAVVVGAGQLRQAKGVEGVGLGAKHPRPESGGGRPSVGWGGRP